jgi:hypothetical protein
VPHHVTLSAERHDKEAMRGWLISRVAETSAPEGFVQWDIVATLVDGNSSTRVRRTSPRIGERNNSLCPSS